MAWWTLWFLQDAYIVIPYLTWAWLIWLQSQINYIETLVIYNAWVSILTDKISNAQQQLWQTHMTPTLTVTQWFSV